MFITLDCQYFFHEIQIFIHPDDLIPFEVDPSVEDPL